MWEVTFRVFTDGPQLKTYYLNTNWLGLLEQNYNTHLENAYIWLTLFLKKIYLKFHNFFKNLQYYVNLFSSFLLPVLHGLNFPALYSYLSKKPKQNYIAKPKHFSKYEDIVRKHYSHCRKHKETTQSVLQWFTQFSHSDPMCTALSWGPKQA